MPRPRRRVALLGSSLASAHHRSARLACPVQTVLPLSRCSPGGGRLRRRVARIGASRRRQGFPGWYGCPAGDGDGARRGRRRAQRSNRRSARSTQAARACCPRVARCLVPACRRAGRATMRVHSARQESQLCPPLTQAATATQPAHQKRYFPVCVPCDPRPRTKHSARISSCPPGDCVVYETRREVLQGSGRADGPGSRLRSRGSLRG